MSNPYETPQGPLHSTGMNPAPGGYGRMGDSPWVTQIMVVCILSFVQAGLELFMGAQFLIAGPMVQQAIETEFQKQANQGQPAPQEAKDIAEMISGFLPLVGALIAVIAVIRIAAGVMNLRYRARWLGILSFITGFLSIFTCYCSVTAIGLAIYGFIVYLNGDARRAFELGSSGLSRQQVQDSPRFT